MQRKSRKLEQGDATRDALVEAARQLFGTQGYADTSLDAIVRRAGVTKGALYHHFSGKESLFRAVYEVVKKDLSQTLSGTLGLQDDAAVWRDLLDRCRDYIQAHTEPCVQRIALLDARAVLSWNEVQRIESTHGVVLIRAALRRATN